MASEEFTALKLAAAQATPGPWHQGEAPVHGARVLAGKEQVACCTPKWLPEQAAANATYLSRVDPTTVLRLVALAEASQAKDARIAELEAMLRRAGESLHNIDSYGHILVAQDCFKVLDAGKEKKDG